MAEDKKPLWKRTIDKVLGTVDLKEVYNPFAEKNMARVLTEAEVQEQIHRGMGWVYGEAEYRQENRRAANRKQQILLPNWSSDNGYYMPHPSGNAYRPTGFLDVPKDPGGLPLPGAAPQTYVGPATHTGAPETDPRARLEEYRDYLTSLYDFRTRRGENLGDIDTFITEAMMDKARAVKTKYRENPANQGARSDGANNTRTTSGSSGGNPPRDR